MQILLFASILFMSSLSMASHCPKEMSEIESLYSKDLRVSDEKLSDSSATTIEFALEGLKDYLKRSPETPCIDRRFYISNIRKTIKSLKLKH